jgi:hypothetical protein
MTEDSVGDPADNREDQRASSEATERQMRLQVWLNGLLAGGPALADAVKPWREGLSLYEPASETIAEDQKDVLESDAKRVEESLMAACRRIRERREQEGNPPLDFSGEEHRRRLAEVLEEVRASRCAGEEFTPLHLVLAARYIEGMIDSAGYRFQRSVA